MKSDPAKTMLTISVGLIIMFLVFDWEWAIIASLVIGLIGVFSTYLSRKVEFLWMKLAYFLGLIFHNSILGAIFYLFLFPISLLAKFFKKDDPLFLNNKQSTYVDSNKKFAKANFEKPW